MNAIKKIMFYLMLAVILFSFMAPTSAYAQAKVFNGNEKVEMYMFIDIPCSGELVLLTGNMHIRWQEVYDPQGGAHLSIQYQPQNLRGESHIGNKFVGTGITRETFNYRDGFPMPYPHQYTFVNNFRIIGQGPGNNYLVHETWHVTINANGELTAYVDNYKVDCK